MNFLSQTLALACGLLLTGMSSAQIPGIGSTFSLEKKEDSLVSGSMSASVTSYAKQQPFYLSYTVSAVKPWHLYYRNPGTVGLTPEIKLDAPEGFQVEGPYWQVPKREEGAIGVFYGYSALSFVWKVTPSADAAGEASFRAESVTQACNDEGCSPPLPAEAEISLSAGDAAANSAWQNLEKKVETLGDSPVAFRICQDSTQTVTLQFDTEQPVSSAYFFSDDNVIAPHLPQVLTRSGNTNSLAMPRNDNADGMYPAPETPAVGSPIKQLKGILIYDDKHMKLTVDDVAKHSVSNASGASTASAMPSNFWTVVGGLFIGGFILNLMPCVFPVIGLKIMSFVELAGGSRRKIFLHSYTFVAGVLFSFWVLSLILIILSQIGTLSTIPWSEWLNVLLNDTGSSERTWAVWMQNPWIVYVLIMLLFVMGLSMYGVFELGVSATGAGQELQKKKGLSGSFFSGLLATVVATPCSAPFLGGALPAALSMPALWLLAAMSFMALGLSLPYIIIGIFPSFVRFLPRPGAWMESLKQGLSFLLFAAVAWLMVTYLAFIPDAHLDSMDIILIGFVIVGCAFWVYGRWCAIYRDKSTRIIGGVCALLLLVSGVIMSIPRAEPSAEEIASRPQWETWSPAAMQAALDAGKPVYVDYTAKWCATCQYNKKVGYNDAVYDKVKELGIVLMRADKTRPNAAIDEELQRLKRTSIPVNVLYQKGQQPAITSELLSPGYLIGFFEREVK